MLQEIDETVRIPASPPPEAWWPVAAGALLALLCLWAALRARRRRRLLEDIPTSRTQGVFIGFVELKGLARAEAPLMSTLAERSCVWYAWSAEEHWSRTVTETYTDSDGKTRTRTKTESGWTTVAGGGEMIPFYLEDATGVILVRPEGAKIESLGVFDRICGPEDPLYYEKGPAEAVMNSTQRRRFHEDAVPVGSRLYVVGQARERDDIVAPEIARSAAAPLFLVSVRSEDQVRKGMGWASWGLWILGLVLLAGGMIGRFVMAERTIRPPAMALEAAFAGAGLLLASGLGWVWMVYNSLVELRQRVRQAGSLVDVQLRRRSDLIPNLVACVKGFRDYESALQAELAELRSQLGATAPGRPGPDPHACLPTVAVIAERYPELKAQESFLRLQEELSDTEERIALARGYYNDIAAFYNTRLEVVPDRLVASLAGLHPSALLAAQSFERAPVAVKF
jgi:hypothetical protein